MAKPRNTLPNRAAMLSVAPGTYGADAAPFGELDALVAAAPPKPVTGIVLLAALSVLDADAAAEPETEAVALPR